MCGILGFTGAPDPDRLAKMLDSIRHRGPDDDASYIADNFCFGMRRLAIIDLTDNIYPVANETGDLQCVFNGEIYNYKALREELKGHGHTFKTESDSEVIIHGYEQWGHEVVQKLRGMFVFFIHDKTRDELFIARDRLGIKPLYYTDVGHRLVFSSEIKAIFAGWPEVDRSADDMSVYKFLISRVHDDTRNTFFRNIKRLMPGHYMIVDNQGNYRMEKYWNPTVNPEFKAERKDEYYTELVREKFIESMKLHLISDVPLGITLSGGLDSSAVTSIASKLLREGTDLHTENKLLTFSAVHPGMTIDESNYIDEVIKYTNATSYKVTPSVDEFWKEINDWVYYQEEPVISAAPYAYYVVMREAHKHVKVLLSGQGGDELFAGYIPYFMSYVQTAQDAGHLLDALREAVQGFDLYSGFIIEKLKAKFDNSNVLDIHDLLNKESLGAEEKTIYFKHKRNLNERLFQDLTSTTVPNLLRYEDKNSMAHSIESRVPFLDHEFVELVMGLPAEQKIKKGWNRYVYRNAMKGLMPEKNRLRRSKIGFTNPEWEWLRAKQDTIARIFESDEFKKRPYWNAAAVHSEFIAWVEGNRTGDGLMFWRILNVELWLRRFVDSFHAL